jgi:hypothetical protein
VYIDVKKTCYFKRTYIVTIMEDLESAVRKWEMGTERETG